MNKGLVSCLTVFVFLSGCASGMKQFDGDRDPAATDGYRSSIDGISLGGVYAPPTNVTPIICKRYEKDPSTGADDLNAFKACTQGVEAARYMAERYSQSEGKYLGCVDGMQQGIATGYQMTKNPSSEQLAEAAGRYQNAKMVSAESRARNQARRDGQSVADGVIISRFRAVVGTNQQPDPSYDYPSHNFTGYDDGYVNDARGGSFDEVYQAGWIPRGTRDFRAIEARAVHKLHRETYAPNKLCQPVQVMFTESPMSLWDYFAARGQYNFEKYGWRDTGRTLNYFVNRISDTPEILFYNAIEGRTMQEAYQVEISPARTECKAGSVKPVLGPDGKPVLGPDGRPQTTCEMVDIPAQYETRYRTVPVPGRDKAYYQGLFKEAFTEAYGRYYLEAYFGRGFVEAHRTAAPSGELIGQLIGRAVAVDYADSIAYNNKYQQDSIAAYNLEWRTNYDSQWARIWKMFAEHAMVEINELAIIGDMDDDIFQAGESVKAQLAMTNLGRKSENISVSMFGSLNGASATHVHPASGVPVSNIFNVPTPNLAQIDKRLAPREGASVGVRVKGAVEFESGLVTQKSQSLVIRDVAEIDAVNATANELTGGGTVQVRIVNPSRLESPSMVKVRVILANNMGTFEQETVKMAGKETRMVSLQISKLDPLEVIHQGGISGTVQTVMAGRVVSERSFSASIPGTYITIARYFNALAIGPDGAVATGSDDRRGRLQEVMAIIQQMTQDDIRSNVKWDEADYTERTVVGQLGKIFLSAKAAGTLNAEAQGYYNELGKNLNTLEISSFKRKAYRKALNTFAPDVKVKKK